MEAAIRVLAVPLSLLLVLGIAVYVFNMIEEKLLRNAGPNCSHSKALNWLMNGPMSNNT